MSLAESPAAGTGRRVRVKPGLVFALLIGALLAAGLLVVRDYGFSTDEGVDKALALIALSRYGWEPVPSDFDYETIGHTRYYGTALSMVFMWADQVLSGPLGVMEGVVRHYGYFLSFITGAIALYFIARLFVGPWAAVFGAALFATQPLLFGHALINPKDIPLLGVFTAAVALGLYADRHPRWEAALEPGRGPWAGFAGHLQNPLLIGGAVVLGIAVSTRVVAAAAGGIVVLYLLWSHRRRAVAPVLIYLAIAAFTMYLSWPMLWEYGLGAAWESLVLFSDFTEYGGLVHFRGELLRGDELPRSYLPHLLSVQFTEPLILLGLLGLVAWPLPMIRERRLAERDRKLALVFLWFALPFGYVVAASPALHNNFRHLLFVTPPVFVFAALAAEATAERLGDPRLAAALGCLALVPGIYHLAVLHPYQYVYYNELVGGVGGAFRNYDLDYWDIGIREAMEYVNAAGPEGVRVLIDGPGFSRANLFRRPDILTVRFNQVDPEEREMFDLAVVPTLWNGDEKVPEDWVLVHAVAREGAVLFGIYEIGGE